MSMDSKASSSRPAGRGGENVPWPEKFTTEQPTKAVAAALGVGFLLNLLPIGKIVGMLAEAVFALARPILLCLGVLKIYDFVSSTPNRSKP